MISATLAALLEDARARLATASATPGLDAEVLLAHALAKKRSFLYAWPQRTPPPATTERFAELLEQRLAGVPVAYLTGRREFWSLELEVTPATLIPRPETELLVELALERLPPATSLGVADLGTGSGAIALTLARERPCARIVATDVSKQALAVVRRNTARLKLHNVELRRGDWCAALNGERFALIVSNPPYVAGADPHLEWGDPRFEPRLALDGGEDGLTAIRTIAAQAVNHLLPGGWLLLEHGYDQGERVTAILRAQGFGELADYRDAAGLGRASIGRRVD